jgi:hypothetical protein
MHNSASFTNVITQCNKPNILNKTCNYTTMDYPIVSFTSNNPTTTCMGTQVSFRKLITSAKVSTPPKDINKSKSLQQNPPTNHH